jgi:hypothetical protein
VNPRNGPVAVTGDRANIDSAGSGFDVFKIPVGSDHRSIEPATTYAEHFRQRLLQDALAEALSIYWERRAQAFLDARPRAGDFQGGATAEQLAALDRRLAATAQACRHRASLGLGADDFALVDQALAKVA